MALTRFNPAAEKQAALKREKAAKKPRILYVEDEDTNWEVTELALRDKYDLSRAKDAREAFDTLRVNMATPFDMILMDIQLHGSDLNGIEITQILKGKFPGTPPDFTAEVDVKGTPIVFVTAYTARYQKEELLQAGGDDLVTKPVDFTRLSLVMSRLTVRQI
jgi:CheY-like chemotaxis protein